MAEKYSAEWIREQVRERASTRLDLRSCSICGTPLYYEFEPPGGEDRVVYHSSCGCTTYYTPPHPSSYEDIARTLAMQSSDAIRDSIVARLDGSPTPTQTETSTDDR
jgi:hypothetical protein